MLTLRRLSLGYRVLYSAVLLFMTAGTAIHGVHQQVRAGLTPDAVAAWYRGNEHVPDAAKLMFPKSFEETWGDVWLALSSYTLALLIFGSIMARSGADPAVRAGLVGGYAGASLAAAAGPLLVRYADPAFAWVESVALVALPFLALAMTVTAVGEMWWLRTEGPRVRAGPTA